MAIQKPTLDKPVDETLTRFCDTLKEVTEQEKSGYVPMEMNSRLLTSGSSAFNVLIRRTALSREESMHFSCCLIEALTYQQTMTMILRRTIAVMGARTLVEEVEKLLNRRKSLNGISDNEKKTLSQYQKALSNISRWAKVPLPDKYVSRCSAEEYNSLPRNLWETFFKQIDSIRE